MKREKNCRLFGQFCEGISRELITPYVLNNNVFIYQIIDTSSALMQKAMVPSHVCSKEWCTPVIDWLLCAVALSVLNCMKIPIAGPPGDWVVGGPSCTMRNIITLVRGEGLLANKLTSLHNQICICVGLSHSFRDDDSHTHTASTFDADMSKHVNLILY